MRSVYNEEMDIIWENYEQIIKKIGFRSMMLATYPTLQKLFELDYRDLFYQVKNNSKAQGKSKQEISYSILKLRRLMAMWQKSNVWLVEGGVSYKPTDRYEEFPLFQCQTPLIVPTEKTLKRLQAKCLHQYIENYNANVAQNIASGRSKVHYIRNLRDLRNVLIAHERISEVIVNDIIKLYGSVEAKKEVNDYSNEGIDIK